MDKDIKTLHEELESSKITSEELVKEAIKDSYTAKDEYNAVVTIVDNASSKEVTKELLSGIPFACKDNYSTAGVLSTVKVIL